MRGRTVVVAAAMAVAGASGVRADAYAEVSKYPDVMIEFQGYQSCLTTGADLGRPAEEIIRQERPKCIPKSARYKMGKVFPKERIDGLIAEMLQFMDGVALRSLREEQARQAGFTAAMDTYAACVREAARRLAKTDEPAATVVRASFGKCLGEEAALKDALARFMKNRDLAVGTEFPKMRADFESRITFEVMELREKKD